MSIALGSRYHYRTPGTLGKAGIYSFNGNKIITTVLITGRPHQCRSVGGGMLVSNESARKLATQARDEAPHYQHSEIGYNYRLSNVLAAPGGLPGRGQLRVLDERVQARRRVCDYYQETLGHLSGIAFGSPPGAEAPWGRHMRWLACITVNPNEFGATREDLRLALEAENIEARPRPTGSRETDAFAARLYGLRSGWRHGRQSVIHRRYVTNPSGKPTAVQVQIETWQAIIALLYSALNENRSFWRGENSGSHHNRAYLTKSGGWNGTRLEIGRCRRDRRAITHYPFGNKASTSAINAP